MTLANQLIEFSRILEDPNNTRFTAVLFYEGYNHAIDYLCLHAPRKLLQQGLEDSDTDSTANGTLTDFDVPTPANSEFVRLTVVTIQSGGAGTHVQATETPADLIGITENSFCTSTATHPRFVRYEGKIKTLHAPAASSVITFYYIKKARDVNAGQTDIDIPVILQRHALRMTVDYARFEDEEISETEMMKRWDKEIAALKTVEEGA